MTARKPASELDVRDYRADDFDAIVDLWRKTGLLRWYNDPAVDLGRWTDAPNARVLIGIRQEAVAATLVVGHDGHRGWLYYLAVDPKRRGRGYARILAGHAERWLVEQGIPKAHAMIRAENLGSRAIYDALGYESNPVAVVQKWLVDKGRPPTLSPAPDSQGRLPVTVTFLEMDGPPSQPPAPPPSGVRLAILRARRPTVPYYRFLYNTVGEPWLWIDRRKLPDAELAEIIQDDRVEIYVAYASGVPAGFVEIDRRNADVVEIAYFGLMPEFIGRGIGPYLLGWSVQEAWRTTPEKVTVNTCTLDHPKALALYQRAGFRPVRQQQKTIDDPRLSGLIPT